MKNSHQCISTLPPTNVSENRFRKDPKINRLPYTAQQHPAENPEEKKEGKDWCAADQAEDGTVLITKPPTFNNAPKRFARLPVVVWSVSDPVVVGVVEGAAVTEVDEADVCCWVLLLVTLLLDGVALAEVVL
jgi:hypothetical protein